MRTLVVPFKGAQLKELGERFLSDSKQKIASEKEAEKKTKLKTQQTKLGKAHGNILTQAMDEYDDFVSVVGWGGIRMTRCWQPFSNSLPSLLPQAAADADNLDDDEEGDDFM